jgi:predicted transcriptional regulator
MADKEQVDQLMDLGNKVARSTIAVVDAITQRGGFKGEELSTIGTLRDQAVQMVQAVETMQADAEFEDDDEAEEEAA